LLGFITGSTPPPEGEITGPNEGDKIPNPALAAWTQTDRLVKAWITATVSEEALGTVVGLITSFDRRLLLKSTHETLRHVGMILSQLRELLQNK
jgi:hypothetical protein